MSILLDIALIHIYKVPKVIIGFALLFSTKTDLITENLYNQAGSYLVCSVELVSLYEKRKAC